MADDEREGWKLQFPSVIVHQKFLGDEDAARRLIGEAQNLLYQVKNRLRLSPDLNQLQSIRIFKNGTIIRAGSIFGQDFTEIYVPPSVIPVALISNTCSVTLIDLPVIVSPMQYPGRIDKSEIAGKDYYKTHYQVDTSKCSLCNNELFTLGVFTGFGIRAGGDILQTLINHSGQFLFYYTNQKNGPNKNVPGRKYNPNNHGIYGYGCYAEVLGSGRDGTGQYFIWKAYTEPWGMTDKYSLLGRNGLGYMQARVHEIGSNASIIQNLKVITTVKYQGQTYSVIDTGETKVVNEYCMGEGIVKVDCCNKPTNERRVRIWWKVIGPGGFINDGIDSWFETPSHISINNLLGFWSTVEEIGIGTVTGGSRHCFTFEAFPEMWGTCYPLDWKLEGPGILDSLYYEELSPSGQMDKVAGAVYGTWCEPLTGLLSMCDPIKITVKDRCETKKEILATCCDLWDESGDEFRILFDSMWMYTDTIQNLIAYGGCWPYKWTLKGPGELIPFGYYGQTARYIAPSDVLACDGATITVTDCCGHTAKLQIAISVPDWGNTIAMRLSELSGSCIEYWDEQYQEQVWLGWTGCETKLWNCYGELISDCYEPMNPGPYGGYCPDLSTIDFTALRCEGSAYHPYNVLVDERVGAMLENCCPLNPFTGYPFVPF